MFSAYTHLISLVFYILCHNNSNRSDGRSLSTRRQIFKAEQKKKGLNEPENEEDACVSARHLLIKFVGCLISLCGVSSDLSSSATLKETLRMGFGAASTDNATDTVQNLAGKCIGELTCISWDFVSEVFLSLNSQIPHYNSVKCFIKICLLLIAAVHLHVFCFLSVSCLCSICATVPFS